MQLSASSAQMRLNQMNWYLFSILFLYLRVCSDSIIWVCVCVSLLITKTIINRNQRAQFLIRIRVLRVQTVTVWSVCSAWTLNIDEFMALYMETIVCLLISLAQNIYALLASVVYVDVASQIIYPMILFSLFGRDVWSTKKREVKKWQSKREFKTHKHITYFGRALRIPAHESCKQFYCKRSFNSLILHSSQEYFHLKKVLKAGVETFPPARQITFQIFEHFIIRRW